MRKTAIEIVLFIVLSLILSLTYNAVSPTGLHLLPKKISQSKQGLGGITLTSRTSMVLS